MKLSRHTLRRSLAILVGAAAILFLLWPWLPLSHSAPTRTITVFGFSIMNDALVEGVFPAFKKEWKETTGEDVEFISSFAGSGTVVNQIVLGVPVQVAVLSHELDAMRLVDAGVVTGETWRDLPHQGIVNRSPMIIVTRPGNPKGIHSFEDLARPNLRIVHPDPLISGAAKWLVLAEYGSLLSITGDSESAVAGLVEIWRNVAILSSSARAASTQFKSGFGDVLVTYEQEVLADAAAGRPWGEAIYPEATIFSEHPAVIIPRNISKKDRALVESFTRFLWSPQAQEAFLHHGFRQVADMEAPETEGMKRISRPLTVAALGGWRRAESEIIKGIWEERVLPITSRSRTEQK